MDKYNKRILKFELGMIIGSSVNLLWLDLNGVIGVFMLVNLGYLGRIITESDWSAITSNKKCSLPDVNNRRKLLITFFNFLMQNTDMGLNKSQTRSNLINEFESNL